jgi:hypothetical protein
VSGFVAWLDHWQTLVSGVLAIAAAVAGAALLRSQIAQTERHEKGRRQNRFNAARALLPLALDGVVGYAQATIAELASALPFCRNHGLLPPSFTIPSAPPDLVRPLQEAIEATEQNNVVALLSDIIGEMQVLSARVRGLSDPQQMRHASGVHLNIEEFLVQAGKLYAMASALFDFARREDDVGPKVVAWGKVVSALQMSHICNDEYSGVYRILERRMHSGGPAWCYGE